MRTGAARLAKPKADNALVEAAVDALEDEVRPQARRRADDTHMFTSSAGIRYDWIPQTDGTTIIRGTQNVADMLEVNKAMYNENAGWTKDKAIRRVASVPAIVRNKVLIETGGGVDLWRSDTDEKWIKRFLNDIDNRHLRTAPGRL